MSTDLLDSLIAPAWSPPAGFHPAPDGSGVHTDLSDADYSKFLKSDAPIGSDDLKHFVQPPVSALPQVNLPQIDVGGSGQGRDIAGGGSGIYALPAAGVSPPPSASAIDVDNARPTAATSLLDSLPPTKLPGEEDAVPSTPQMSGVSRQLALPASNLAQGAIGLAGFPGDVVRGIGALGGQQAASALQGNPLPQTSTFFPQGKAPLEPVAPQMIAAAPGKEAITPPTGHNPLDTESLMGLTNAAGITNRPDLQPQNSIERAEAAAAQGIGMVAPSILTGGLSAAPSAPGLIRSTFNAARPLMTGAGLGLGAEYGGDVGQAVGGTPGRVIGGAIGSVIPAVVGGGVSKLASGMKPVIQSAFPVPWFQRDIAARSFAGANTPEVRAALANPPELVPGSPVTSYQATGNPVLGTAERGMANQKEYAPSFNAVRQQQNAARVASIAGQAPKDADVGGIVPWFRGRLQQMRDSETADVGGERAVTQNAVDAMGEPIAPHEAGGMIRGAVETARAPRVSASNRAIEAAQKRAEREAGALGGNVSPQSEGARMRGERPSGEAEGSGVQGQRAKDRAAADRLYDAVDPEGKLVAGGLVETGDTAAILRGDAEPRRGWPIDKDRADYLSEFSAASRSDLDSAETKVLDFAAGFHDAEKFQDVRKLQRMIAAAQRDMGPRLGYESLPYKRMTELRNATEDALANAAGDAAKEDATVSEKLAAMAKEESNGPVGGESGGRGDEGGSGSGEAGVPGASGEQGASGAGRGNAAGDRGVANAGATRRPESLVDFLISRGGIKDQGGDLKANDLDKLHHQRGGRLVNPNGMPLDRAREAAVEAGFLPQNADINALLDAVTSQNPIYRQADTAVASDLAQRQRDVAQETHDRFMAAANVDDVVSRLGVRISSEEHARATDLALHGAHPEDAVRQAVSEGDDAVFQRNAEHNAVGSPGVPVGATQGEMPVGRARLVPNLTPEDVAALRKANANYADYKAKYGRGAIGAILKPSNKTVSGFAVEDSGVPAKIFAKGSSGAEAADSLIAAMGHEGALKVLGEYPAYSLRQAAEDMGTLNVKKYEKWADDHAAVLDKFPELKASFDSAAKARAVLNDLKAERAALDKSNPIKAESDNAQVMRQYALPGPRGYEGAEKLVRDTGGSPAALATTRDYLASDLRRDAMIKTGPNAGTLDQGAYNRWMKEHDSFLSHPALADTRAAFADAGRAQEALDAAALEHVAAQAEFNKSVAGHFLGDYADPVRAMDSIIGRRDPAEELGQLGRMTSTDPTAREAIQSATIHAILDRIRSNNVIGSDLEQTALKNEAAQNLIEKLVGTDLDGPLRHVMTPEQMRALNNVKLDMRRSNLSVGGNRPPSGGSDTALLTSARESGQHNPGVGSVIAAMEGLGELGGHLVGPLGRVVGMITVPFLTAMRRAGFEKVNDLRAEALLHPDKMSALLARLPTEAEVPSRLAAIRGQLAAYGAVSGARLANDDIPIRKAQ